MPITALSEYPPDTVLNSCYICKASRRADERVIDTGVYIDFEGRLVLCGSCIAEAADALGLLAAKAAARLAAKVDKLSAQLDEATIQRDAYAAANDALRRLDAVVAP